MSSEIKQKADFSFIRYAQCWEDADVLNEALQVKAGDVCLSIASAGDNSLSLLANNPERVIALDLNPAQLACLELRVASYKVLEHHELLSLIIPGGEVDRLKLYQRCKKAMSKSACDFWDANQNLIVSGIGASGKFEKYFSQFREKVLPFIHNKKTIRKLLEKKSKTERENFYARHWNNWRWKLLFRIFFSRYLMGKMGRDPQFFNYVKGSVADRILNRTQHALTEIDTAENSYLHWILTGRYDHALPRALRAEYFDPIRDNIHKIEWHLMSIEDFFQCEKELKVDKFNLSDIFEYMSLESYHSLLQSLVKHSSKNARLAYWNMLAPRSRPESMVGQLHPLEIADQLHKRDNAFFYSRFVVEEVL